MRKGQLDMRTKLRSKISLLFMTCAVLLAIPAIALADNAIADGDGLAPIVDQDMAFGNVACGVESQKSALIAINRNGSAGSTNVFKDGSTVTVSVELGRTSQQHQERQRVFHREDQPVRFRSRFGLGDV